MLPLDHNAENFWPFGKGSFSIWPNFELIWANFICHWVNLHCSKWRNIKHLVTLLEMLPQYGVHACLFTSWASYVDRELRTCVTGAPSNIFLRLSFPGKWRLGLKFQFLFSIILTWPCYEHFFRKHAVVVVKWSACSPSTLTVRVLIPLKSAI